MIAHCNTIKYYSIEIFNKKEVSDRTKPDTYEFLYK